MRVLGEVVDSNTYGCYAICSENVNLFQPVLIDDNEKFVLGIVKSIKAQRDFKREVPEALEVYKKYGDNNKFLVYIQYIYEIYRNREGRYVITTVKSPVRLFSRVLEISDDVSKILTSLYKEPIYVGYLRGSKVPFYLEGEYLPYHIGIFGSTGTGKSRLAAIIAKEAKARGYNLIIFDHSGRDYVPYFGDSVKVIPSNKIKIRAEIIGTVLAKMAGLLNSSRSESYLQALVLAADLYTQLLQGKVTSSWVREVGISITGTQVRKWEYSTFIRIAKEVARRISRSDIAVRLEIFLNKPAIKEFIESLNERTIDPYTIEGNVIIDLSKDIEIEVKQSIVHEVLENLWNRKLYHGDTNKYLVVIDEAQNYAAHYWERTVCYDIINRTAREGRKYNIGLVLISQKYRDIDTVIRQNLNTIFIGRMYNTQDVEEALPGYSNILTQLNTREFLVQGVGTLINIPVLVYTKFLNSKVKTMNI